jgi:hypothetical protein
VEALRVLGHEDVVVHVLREGREICDLLRLLPQVQLEADRYEGGAEVGPDGGDGAVWAESYARAAAVAGGEPGDAVEDVDAHGDDARAVRHGSCREAARVKEEAGVPPLRQRRRERQLRLAEHLRRQVQRLLRRPPLRVGQSRPVRVFHHGYSFVRGEHASPQRQSQADLGARRISEAQGLVKEDYRDPAEPVTADDEELIGRAVDAVPARPA